MTTIHIEGMSCAHCAAAVHKALEALGLTGVQVDATRGEAVFAGTVDREELRRAIAAGSSSVTQPVSTAFMWMPSPW